MEPIITPIDATLGAAITEVNLACCDDLSERYDSVVHRSAQADLDPYDERRTTCAQ